MTNAEMTRKLYRDFSNAELQMLGTKSVTTIHNMAQDDRIIIEDSLLDYLRDFFNGIFDGEPIPKVFSSALIEWNTANNMLIRMYVSFPEDKKDWVYIDVFQGWTFIGKVLYPNLKMDDSERNEDGQFFGFTPFLTTVQFPEEIKQALIPAVKDIFTYAYLYVQANKEEKVLFKEEPKAIPGQSNKKSKKKSNKSKKSGDARDKVFVPTRRVYTLKKTETTERALCEYVYSRWKVRGYSYTRKDGRVINVKEHYAFRHFPNKGVDKEGKDFILRKGEDANN